MFIQTIILWSIAFSITSSAFLLASIRRLPFSRAWRTPSPNRCPRCGYDLSGLPPGAHCPECGPRLHDPKPPRLIVHPARLGQWWVMLLWYIVSTLASYPLAYLLLTIAYRRDGFTAAQALGAIPARELHPGGAGPGGQVWPLMLAAVVLPVVALALPPRWFRWGIAVVLVVGVGMSAVAVLGDCTVPVPP